MKRKKFIKSLSKRKPWDYQLNKFMVNDKLVYFYRGYPQTEEALKLRVANHLRDIYGLPLIKMLEWD